VKIRQRLRLEDYLITILEICERSGSLAKTGEVARQLGVTNGTASTVIKELASAGCVDRTPYSGAALTSRGKRAAVRTRQRRRLLTQFLEETLASHGLSDHANEARLIEQVVTDELLSSVEAYLRWASSGIRE